MRTNQNVLFYTTHPWKLFFWILPKKVAIYVLTDDNTPFLLLREILEIATGLREIRLKIRRIASLDTSFLPSVGREIPVRKRSRDGESWKEARLRHRRGRAGQRGRQRAKIFHGIYSS